MWGKTTFQASFDFCHAKSDNFSRTLVMGSIPRSDCDGQEVWARSASTEGVTEVEVRGGRGDASRVKRPELILRTLLGRRTAQDVSASCYPMMASGSAAKSAVNLVLIVGDHSGFGGLEFFQIHGGK